MTQESFTEAPPAFEQRDVSLFLLTKNAFQFHFQFQIKCASVPGKNSQLIGALLSPLLGDFL